MRHVYECPLRWADMDMLGHVNNVTYVDYLQEARIDMFATHAGFSGVADLAEGVVVVSHRVEFVSPLVFDRPAVKVEVWITQIRAATFTMAYEVYDEPAQSDRERIVYLRATSVLAPYVFANEAPRRLTADEREVLTHFLEPTESPPSTAGPARAGFVSPIKVRFSDVDVYRHVNNVKYFEYFQEARIQFLMHLQRPGELWNDHVVGRTEVDYRAPLLFRLEPYDVHSWISGVGNRSYTISAEIRDGDTVFARDRVVMVTFDRETQQSTDMTPDQRARLSEELDG